MEITENLAKVTKQFDILENEISANIEITLQKNLTSFFNKMNLAKESLDTKRS